MKVHVEGSLGYIGYLELPTHAAARCLGQTCSVHNPSNHKMINFSQTWRADRGLMERQCPHGVGHPDPDDIALKRRKRGDEYADTESIHGCDGCCE